MTDKTDKTRYERKDEESNDEMCRWRLPSQQDEALPEALPEAGLLLM